MQWNVKRSLTQEEKNRLIEALTPELATLRSKAEISQEELSELIGVSRQTYGALERGVRKMSWATFLSLVLFYGCNQKTHRMLRSIRGIPQEMIKRFNPGSEENELNLETILGESADAILGCLDEQAKQSIRTMILVEYARCTSTPGDVIVKSFDGLRFDTGRTVSAVEAEKALRSIREQKTKHGQP